MHLTGPFACTPRLHGRHRGEPIDKPKGMRWPTYDRHMERIDRAEEIATGHPWLLIDRLNKGLRR